MPTSPDSERERVVVAFAGRRVDPPDAKQPRFPLINADEVKKGIRFAFESSKAAALASSAACGADLLALEAAGELRIRRRVVLPFSRETFRRTSVIDRPGDWGPRYDKILDEVERNNDLVLLGYSEDDPDAYVATNRAILDEAVSIGTSTVAVVAWDQQSRGPDDITEQFIKEAERRGIRVHPVPTV
jgi:hypothetical protein